MDKKRFGQFIREARTAKNLTQAELAEKLFIDVTAVSKWERGIHYPDISMISDICRCLGVTEHELIESSEDTEYRQMMYCSKRYLRNRKIAFWSVTGAFLLAVLICFIVEICVSHTLSWFFIVLSSCACGYWAMLYPALFCVAKKRLEENTARLFSKFALLLYVTGLLLLTLAILFTAYAYTPYDIVFAVKITLYCFLLPFLYGFTELLPMPRLTKLGIDSLVTGAFTVSLAKVLPALMKVKEENYFDVDFTDWAGHTNGNVSTLILACFGVLGVVLILLGAAKKRH